MFLRWPTSTHVPHQMRRVVAAFAVTALCAACSKTGDAPTAATPNPTPGSTTQVASPVPPIDKAKPLSAYQELKTPQQTTILFHALNSAPLDLEKVVERYSVEYQATTDSFKKKEIVASLSPSIEAELAKAKTDRYFFFELNPGMYDRETFGILKSYDFDKKGFPVKLFLLAKTAEEIQALRDRNPTASLYETPGVTLMSGGLTKKNGYPVALTNWAQYKVAPVADTDKAKVIEELVAKRTPLRMKIYMHANGIAEKFNTFDTERVAFEIVKIQINDPLNNLLIEF